MGKASRRKWERRRLWTPERQANLKRKHKLKKVKL